MGGGRQEGDETKRLLLYAENRLQEPIVHWRRLRDRVWLVGTKTKKVMMKQYGSDARLKRQMLLTSELQKSGFTQTCRFLEDESGSPFQGKTFGFMAYIEEDPAGFTFGTEEDIRAAFRLLKQYHEKTAHFPQAVKMEFPRFFQLRKWQARYRAFLENKEQIVRYLPETYFTAYERWAGEALNRLEKKQHWLHRPPYCITHGDVAHHNFLRAKNGKLYLIDFDLARLAPAWTDDLQFCNRVLPAASWSLAALENWGMLDGAPDRETFLEALLYPTDVLREWNRFAGSGKKEKEQYWPHLSPLSIGQFEERARFQKEVKRRLQA